MHGQGAALTNDEYEKLCKTIDQQIRKLVKKPFFAAHLLIGSGGTFTSLAEMMMAVKQQDDLPTRGYTVTHAELAHLLDRLRKMPLKVRRTVAGLSTDRADIIVAGLAVIDRLMRHFEVNLLQVHNRGVRDGLILTMIDQQQGDVDQDPHNRETAIDRFAAACSGELVHGRQVARLAGRIYQPLAQLYDLDPADQSLLEAAARLQDVGYLINYDQHHKHSYHLILHSGLPGFQPHELELIANIARYHRGSKPKPKHANYQRLSPEDKKRVARLAAILRVAGGLDRSHTGQVRDVSLVRGTKGLELWVESPEIPEVDLWARAAAPRCSSANSTRRWQSNGGKTRWRPTASLSQRARAKPSRSDSPERHRSSPHLSRERGPGPLLPSPLAGEGSGVRGCATQGRAINRCSSLSPRPLPSRERENAAHAQTSLARATVTVLLIGRSPIDNNRSTGGALLRS